MTVLLREVIVVSFRRMQMRKMRSDSELFLVTCGGWLGDLPTRLRRVAIAGLVVALGGCLGYVPGRQSYWDAKVKEMCDKDGGVTIYEKLRVSNADVELLGKVDGKFSVPIKQLAPANAPAYAVQKRTLLGGEGSVHIGRLESTIIRGSDQKILARWVIYSRTGGDFPSPAHASTFSCPDLKTITSELQSLFIVEGTSE
jgi:hypothetical protein